MSNYWKERFEKNGADGIDFVPLFSKPWDVGTIYESKTKAEMLAGTAYPRSNYFFWKLVNGQKVYIVDEKYQRKPGEISANFEKTPIYIVEDVIACMPVFITRDRQTAEEMCLSYIEEAAYAESLLLYTHHHHWSMEKACTEGWKRNLLSYTVREDSIVDFMPF